MFQFNGVFTQYDDPVNILDPLVISVAAGIRLPRYKGAIWNRLLAPPKPISRDSFEIAGRTDAALSGSTGAWNNSDTTGLDIDAGDDTVIQIGSVLRVTEGALEEIVVVTAVDLSGNTIDVDERGAGASSAQTFTTAATFQVIGSAINDIQAKNVQALGENTHKYKNFAQLIFEPIDVTKSGVDEARKYLESNAQLQTEALGRVFKRLATSIIHGTKREGAAAKAPLTAGILEFLQETNGGDWTPIRENASGAFTEDKLKSIIDAVHDKGNPNAIYLSQTNRKIVNEFTNAANLTLSTGTDLLTKRGLGNFATHYQYNGAEFELVEDTDYPDDRVGLVDEQKIYRGFKTNDALSFVEEPKASSRQERFSYQGKWGCIVEGIGFDHGEIYGIT